MSHTTKATPWTKAPFALCLKMNRRIKLTANSNRLSGPNSTINRKSRPGVQGPDLNPAGSGMNISPMMGA